MSSAREHPRPGDRSLGRIFRWPLCLGLASLGGLLSALLGDGPWDVLSWVLLGGPVLVGLGLAWCERPGLKRRLRD